jgi:CubicO group peptidase (beta-lactamase class C family)
MTVDSFTRAVLERARDRARIPGLAAARVRLGEPPEFLCIGEARPGRPVDPDTVFPIASITKTFTAALCALRVRSGVWRWTDRVRDLWPDFALHDADAAARITLLDTLIHRSGLPPHTWAWVFAPPDRARFLRERLPHLAPVAKFDAGVRYSNLFYALAGGLLEIADGVSWEDRLARDLLHPLGLRHTQPAVENWQEAFDAAQPHRAGEPIAPFHARARHVIAPASELFSTAADLASWLGVLLGSVEFSDCFTPRLALDRPRPHPDLAPLHYGIGWRVERFAKGSLVWHSGQCTGYTAWLGFQPQQRQGWVLLTNADGVIDTVQALAYSLASGEDWLDRLVPPLPPAAPEAAAPAGEPFPLPPGRYTHPGYGTLAVAADGQARLDDSAPGHAIRTADGAAYWVIPGYGTRVPLHIRPTELHLHFEPELPPQVFVRQEK